MHIWSGVLVDRPAECGLRAILILKPLHSQGISPTSSCSLATMVKGSDVLLILVRT